MDEDLGELLFRAILRDDCSYVEDKLSRSTGLIDLKANRGNNLLHIAVLSNSLQCVITVLKHVRFDETNTNDNNETPLHYAIRMRCSTEIAKHLIDYCPRFLQVKNICGQLPIHLAFEKENTSVIKEIFAAEKKCKILDQIIYVQHFLGLLRTDNHKMIDFLLKTMDEVIGFDIEHFYNLMLYEDTIFLSDKTLNILFSYLWSGWSGGFNYTLFAFALRLLTSNRLRSEYRSWLFAKVYLHRKNAFSLAARRINNRQRISVMIFLNWNFIGRMSQVLQICRHEPVLIHHFHNFYNILFRLSLNRPHQFKHIVKYANRLWTTSDNIYLRAESINFFYILHKEGAHLDPCFRGDFRRFLHDIGARDFHTVVLYTRRMWHELFLMSVPVLMPFIAVPSADHIVSLYKETIRGPALLPDCEHYFAIKDYCGPSYRKSAMSLKEICRTVVRETVFNAKEGLTNAQKLDNLKHLNIPNELREFLFYNYLN